MSYQAQPARETWQMHDILLLHNISIRVQLEKRVAFLHRRDVKIWGYAHIHTHTHPELWFSFSCPAIIIYDIVWHACGGRMGNVLIIYSKLSDSNYKSTKKKVIVLKSNLVVGFCYYLLIVTILLKNKLWAIKPNQWIGSCWLYCVSSILMANRFLSGHNPGYKCVEKS